MSRPVSELVNSSVNLLIGEEPLISDVPSTISFL